MTTTIVKTVTAVKAEAAEGVAETLVAADSIETLVAPSLAPNLETITREVAGGTLTEATDQAGRSSAALTIPMQLAGPSDGDPTTAPTWSELFQACGFKQTACKVVVVDSVDTAGDAPANRFLHEETVTFAASTATARVIGDHHFDAAGSGIRMTYLIVEELTGAIVSGDTTATGSLGTPTVVTLQAGDNGLRDAIAWEPWDLSLGSVASGAVSGGGFVDNELLVGGTSGARARSYGAQTTGPILFERWLGSASFVNAETITGQTSGETCTTSAAETWYTLPSLTIATQLPGVERSLYGARGNWTLTLANGQLAGLSFEMTGRHPQPLEVVPFLNAPAARDARPPKVTGSQVKLNGVYVPCFQTLSINSESTVALRECLPDATGYKSTMIVDRKLRGSIDPETIAEGIFPMLGNAWDKTSFLLEVIVGDDTVEDGNAMVIRGPQAQATGYTPGDRERIPIDTIPLKFGGGTRDEFVLFTF